MSVNCPSSMLVAAGCYVAAGDSEGRAYPSVSDDGVSVVCAWSGKELTWGEFSVVGDATHA